MTRHWWNMELDPAANPAVLDTATWETESAAGLANDGYFTATRGVGFRDHNIFCFGRLHDGQYVVIEFCSQGLKECCLGKPFATTKIDDKYMRYYPVDNSTIQQYVTVIRPDKAPRALGPIPRLGIGNRMTTASWPAIYRAMAEGGFAANAIQNSMRELHLLDDLKNGTSPPDNYTPNVGAIVSGHTGSTWEGLWLYGVLEALKADGNFRYGADADHIQVKRNRNSDPDYDRAVKVIDATAKYYTLFTLDVSDLIRHDADVVKKYDDALFAMGMLSCYIEEVRGDKQFDLEIAIDEVPASMKACECITADDDLLHVIQEARVRSIPLTHIAPNFGIEKERDYRCPDGLKGLAERIRRQTKIAKDNGVILDFHSGDDLSKATRQVIGEATDGYLHFKVSPRLQLMFAETLADFLDQPDDCRKESDLLHDWIIGTLETNPYMRWLAKEGQTAQITQNPLFHNYAFAWVGQWDAQGRFKNRHRFYELSDEFYRAYQDRIVAYLLELQGDLGLTLVPRQESRPSGVEEIEAIRH